ncbi:MAG: hypothetical protein JWP81_316 [Ferruginibacter sp.]|nr:hypothetical protein [Ferruginibacter sp.]
MNWEVVSNDRSSLKEYRMIDNNDCKVIIKYNPKHQSARITSGNRHRLFFLESAGSLNGKTIFKNEYGMEIGSLVHDKFRPREGSLLIDSKKYQYELQNSPAPRLVIFESDTHRQVANCSIPATKASIANILPSVTQSIDNNCYLLGLCWYLFLPVVKENVLEYSSAAF